MTHRESTPQREKSNPTNTIGNEDILSTVLPDFELAKQSNAGIGHNSGNVEDPTEDLMVLRRILTGPSKEQLDAKLDMLVSILEEREADLVKRETAVNGVISQMEQRLAGAMGQLENKHDRIVGEVGRLIAALGAEILDLGGGPLRNGAGNKCEQVSPLTRPHRELHRA